MEPEDRERLVRVETKLDILVERKDDHERRMRSLERERWAHRGGLAVLAAMISGKLGFPWPHL